MCPVQPVELCPPVPEAETLVVLLTGSCRTSHGPICLSDPTSHLSDPVRTGQLVTLHLCSLSSRGTRTILRHVAPSPILLICFLLLPSLSWAQGAPYNLWT